MLQIYTYTYELKMANPGQLPGGVFPSVAGIPGPQQQHQQRPFLSQPPTGLVTQLSSPAKEVNTASLCKIGQELVQDIVQKTQEVFQTLKVMQVSFVYFFKFFSNVNSLWKTTILCVPILEMKMGPVAFTQVYKMSI